MPPSSTPFKSSRARVGGGGNGRGSSGGLVSKSTAMVTAAATATTPVRRNHGRLPAAAATATATTTGAAKTQPHQKTDGNQIPAATSVAKATAKVEASNTNKNIKSKASTRTRTTKRQRQRHYKDKIYTPQQPTYFQNVSKPKPKPNNNSSSSPLVTFSRDDEAMLKTALSIVVLRRRVQAKARAKAEEDRRYGNDNDNGDNNDGNNSKRKREDENEDAALSFIQNDGIRKGLEPSIPIHTIYNGNNENNAGDDHGNIRNNGNQNVPSLSWNGRKNGNDNEHKKNSTQTIISSGSGSSRSRSSTSANNQTNALLQQRHGSILLHSNAHAPRPNTLSIQHHIKSMFQIAMSTALSLYECASASASASASTSASTTNNKTHAHAHAHAPIYDFHSAGKNRNRSKSYAVLDGIVSHLGFQLRLLFQNENTAAATMGTTGENANDNANANANLLVYNLLLAPWIERMLLLPEDEDENEREALGEQRQQQFGPEDDPSSRMKTIFALCTILHRMMVMDSLSSSSPSPAMSSSSTPSNGGNVAIGSPLPLMHRVIVGICHVLKAIYYHELIVSLPESSIPGHVSSTRDEGEKRKKNTTSKDQESNRFGMKKIDATNAATGNGKLGDGNKSTRVDARMKTNGEKKTRFGSNLRWSRSAEGESLSTAKNLTLQASRGRGQGRGRYCVDYNQKKPSRGLTNARSWRNSSSSRTSKNNYRYMKREKEETYSDCNLPDMLAVNLMILLEEIIELALQREIAAASVRSDRINNAREKERARQGSRRVRSRGGSGRETVQRSRFRSQPHSHSHSQSTNDHYDKNLENVGLLSHTVRGMVNLMNSCLGELALPISTQELAAFYVKQRNHNRNRPSHEIARKRGFYDRRGRTNNYSRTCIGHRIHSAGELMNREGKELYSRIREVKGLNVGGKIMLRLSTFDLVQKLSSHI